MSIFSTSEKRNSIDPVKNQYLVEAQEIPDQKLRRFIYTSIVLTSQLLESILDKNSPEFLRRQRSKLNPSLVKRVIAFWVLEDLASCVGFEELNKKERISVPLFEDSKKFEQGVFSFFGFGNESREVYGTLKSLGKESSDTYKAYLWLTFRHVLGDIESTTPEETELSSSYPLKRSVMFRKLI